jgi:hypothetical protein
MRSQSAPQPSQSQNQNQNQNQRETRCGQRGEPILIVQATHLHSNHISAQAKPFGSCR